MKRITQDYAGRPMLEKPRPEVIGQRAAQPVADVASSVSRWAGGFAADRDAEILDDFAEFLKGTSDSRSAGFSAIDPDFKRRLRRQLWRLHLMLRPKPSNDSH